MALGSLGTLTIRLEADIARFERALTRSEQVARRRAENLKKIFTKVGVAIGTALASGVLIRGFDKAIDRLDRMAKSATRLGTTTQAMREMALVAETSGIKFATLQMAMQRLTRRMGEVSLGTGEARKAVAALGLNVEEFIGLKADEQIMKLAEVMSGVNNQSQKLALTMKFLDSEGVALVQMFANSVELTKAYREALRSVSNVTEQQARAVERVKSKFDTFGESLEGLSDNIAVFLVPTFETIVDFLLTQMVPALAETGAIISNVGKIFGAVAAAVHLLVEGEFKAAGETFTRMADDLKLPIERFREVQSAMQNLLNEMREAGPAAAGATQGIGSLGDKAGEAAEKVTALSLALDMVSAQFEQLEQAEASGIAGFDEDLDRVTQALQQMTQAEDEAFQLLESIEAVQDRLTGQQWADLQNFAIGKLDATLKKTDRGLNKTKDLGQQMGVVFESSFQKALLAGEDFGEVLKGLGRDIIGLLVQKFVTGPIAGGIGDFLSEALPFQHGGHAPANKPLLVGERGPEIVSFDRPSHITPNGAIGGTSIVYNIDARGADAGVEQRVRRAILESENRAVQRSIGAVADSKLRGGSFAAAFT